MSITYKQYLQHLIDNKMTLIWNDPDPIVGNDYRINEVRELSDDMAYIEYGEGSVAEVPITEIGVYRNYQDLTDRYNEVENEIIAMLEKEVNASFIESENHKVPCLKISLFDYTELLILNGRLQFADSDGLLYNLFNDDVRNDDLLDILNQIEG